MPADYGLKAPTGPDSFISWQTVTGQLAAARSYWIATTRPDGRPHVRPVWGLWLDETFCFSTGPTSIKARNLAANPHLTVHLESGDDVVILEGRLGETSDPDFLARFNQAYQEKYAVNVGVTSALYLVPDRVLAWQENNFIDSATRWRYKA